MAGKWVKATFLALLGIIILIYGPKFVDEMEAFFLENDISTFDMTWDLLLILIWILVAWLFVDAALTVAISFSEHKYNLGDVMKRLDKIDKRLAIGESIPKSAPVEVEEVSEVSPEVAPAEIEPPPP